jgi:Flp pilus assembly protein protease CpaA
MNASIAAVCGALGAALLVRALAAPGQSSGARRAMWVAGLVGAAAAVVGSLSEAPVAGVIAGTGLAAAAVIDAVELRIPAGLAHATTVGAAVALVSTAAMSSSWGIVGNAAAGTLVVVVACGGLWLAGLMGFGDVRLTGATATASLTGVTGAIALLWGACLAAGVTALARRRWATAPAQVPEREVAGSVGAEAPLSIPFAPAILVGWALAVLVT